MKWKKINLVNSPGYNFENYIVWEFQYGVIDESARARSVIKPSSESSAQGQVFHYKLRNQGRSSAQRQVFHHKLRHKVAVLLAMNMCDSFPLLSAPHSLFGIWTDLERSEKIPGAPSLRWGEWIWLTGPSGFQRNSPQSLNISSIRVFDQIRDPEIPITLRPHIYIYTSARN